MPDQSKAEDLIEKLRDRFASGALEGDTSSPMQIKLSSRILYREGDKPVNKLTDVDAAIIEAALDAETVSAKAPSQTGKAINIDFGEERVFRYTRENGVEIDASRPIALDHAAVPNEVLPIESVQSAIEPQPDLADDESLADLLVPEGIDANLDEATVKAAEAATDAALADLGMTRESAFEPDLDPEFDPELALVEAVEPIETEAFVADLELEPPDSAAVDLGMEAVDPALAEVDPLPVQAAVPPIVNVSSNSIATESEAPSSPDKLPAAAIAWAQLAACQLPEGSREWLTQTSDQFAEVANSAFGRTVQEKGAEAATAAWTQVTSLAEQTKNRAIADSIVALTKEYGSFQEQDDQKRWVYQAETFKVEVKGTNAYTVSDHEGNKLLPFKDDRWRGPTQVENNLAPMQAFDIVQAGTELSAVKAWEAARQSISKTKDTAQSLIDRAQQLSDRFGNLAPQGTREQLIEGLDRQAANLAQTLVSSKEAVQTAAGSFFDGKPFAAFKLAATDAVGMLREGVEGAVLKQEAGGGIRSRFGLPDLKFLNQFQQVQQRVEQSIAAVAAVGKSRDRDR